MNCFGFVDSGVIDLSEPGNLVYFLGRNSSGKTSVLRAISYFEVEETPAEHPNFVNYEPPAGSPLLQARFSVDPSGSLRLSVDRLVRRVIRRFENTPLQIRQGDDGFSVNPPSQGAGNAARLLEHIHEVYSDLIERIHEGGQVWVQKLANGSYRFLTEENNYEDYGRRQQSISALINDMYSSFATTGQPLSASLDFNYIEGRLFWQFPEIFVFTDRFSLEEDLPRSLSEENLGEAQNALTSAFVSLLDPETLRNLLRANRRFRIESLTQELQGKLDSLCSKINEDASQGAADADFLRIYIDRHENVRIVLEVDAKESYYEHLSDNTKFLVAYHIFQEDRDLKNSRPSILLFDEPNKGFHPSAEGKMLRFLESLAESGNQILVTTHSQHMIDLDRLTAVRIMSRAADDTLRVDNRLYGEPSKASRDTLALQPVSDAIGLRYADQLVTQDKVVVTEGYTELLYLRLFARLLGRDEPNLAPVTGEGKIIRFLPFLVSQGISFKVALDSAKTKRNIQEAVPVPDDSFFVVAEHLGTKANDPIGVEDLFSKDNFEMLLKRCGHVTNVEHFNNVSNSRYAKSTGVKALVAHGAYESTDLDKTLFSEETNKNFEALLNFCENSNWFRA